MSVFCGIDWAEDHHDVAVVDEEGKLLAKRRISDDAEGHRLLLEVLAEYDDRATALVPVAIETSHGLLVAALRAAGRLIYAINPMAASRYRDRHAVSRKKSDHGDAVVLANILRTDKASHRPLPAHSELSQAITVLARAQQDAVWNYQQLSNQLRSHLREYFPAALIAFQHLQGGLTRGDARAVLAIASTPGKAIRLSRSQLRAALKRGGRQRGIDADAERIQDVFRAEYLRHTPMVEEAMGLQMLALLRQLDAACKAADELAESLQVRFREHPDAHIVTSFPGLSDLAGARVLAEIGDDRSYFTSARALKAYAGSAPVTRASGKVRIVTHRVVKNRRLASCGYVWTLTALRASPGARAHYKRRREVGDRHSSAQRNLFNKLLGQLHHCLQTRQTYNESRAFSQPAQALAA
ncbi:IS117 transposase [Streptomyces bingchenggensis BCW-1]|uniref:IS117 transposase n=1 Tax=Streptomyces bingchenggensis (strain BCW-1) TaxID=749414 RepID=D7CBQ3_STRBB|nr:MULTISPECIES: IS110 family transposase [Streptomyces]ADI04398.1 IS117 transposase [Streptomyces bingchenggensis BCW-1]